MIPGLLRAAAAGPAGIGVRRARFRLPTLSLHVRATAKVAVGLVSIALVAWLAHDEAVQMSADAARVASDRQVAADAQDLLVGMLDQQTGLAVAGRLRAAQALIRLEREARTPAERADVSNVVRSTDAWEAWADAGSDSPAAGQALFDRFQSDDTVLGAAARSSAAGEAADASALQETETLRLLVAAACAGLAMFLIVYQAHWQVLRPVWRLARAAADLAADRDVDVPFTDRHDEIGALAAALVDWRYTTAARLAVAKMAAESDARFKTVFDRAPIGTARVGMGGRLLDANPTLREMLGYEGDEMLRLTMADVVHRRDRDRLLALQKDHTDRFVMETRLLKPDGTIFWGLITAALQRLEGGRPLFYVVMVEDINDRKRQESELQHQVSHDGLTGLANRRHFLSAVDATLADRRLKAAAIFVIDLDGFKEVNDGLGHAAGDELLRQVSARMTESMRNSDLVARLGGDEFAVLLPATDRRGADVAARKLLGAFRRPFHVEGKTVRVGASLGVSLAPEHARETASLVERADLAMYRAKRAGGGVEIAA